MRLVQLWALPNRKSEKNIFHEDPQTGYHCEHCSSMFNISSMYGKLRCREQNWYWFSDIGERDARNTSINLILNSVKLEEQDIVMIITMSKNQFLKRHSVEWQLEYFFQVPFISICFEKLNKNKPENLKQIGGEQYQ